MPRVRGPHDEDYEQFFHHWTDTQKQQLEELEQALDSDMRENELKALVDKVEQHYDYYYGAKDNAARQNVLQVMTPSWRTPLETAFMWIGGWRPSMVFHLAYALAGQQIEAELAELLAGIDSPSMASLSARQLERINELQVKTQKEEDDLSHRMAVLQQAMADQPFVGYVQATLHDEEEQKAEDVIEGAVDDKLKDMEKLLIDADNLRKNTLHQMLEILTPVQAAQYLVAAAQLQIAFRKVGDLKRRNGTEAAAEKEASPPSSEEEEEEEQQQPKGDDRS